MNDFTYPVPKNWQWTTLCHTLSGHRFGVKPLTNGEKTLLLVRPKNIFHGRVDLSNAAKVTSGNHSLLRPGEILVSWAHSYDKVGKAGLYVGEEAAICSSSLVRLQVDKKIAYPGYLTFWLNSEIVKRFLTRIKHKGIGASKININTYIKRCPVLLPPKEKQKQIAKTLTAWDSALYLLQMQIDLLSKQRRGVAQLFLNQI